MPENFPSEMHETLNAFTAEYVFDSDGMPVGRRFPEYIVGVGMTWRGHAEYHRANGSRPLPEVREELQAQGEDPDEVYILVLLRKQLPDDLALPDEYQGLKIYLQLVGDPEAY